MNAPPLPLAFLADRDAFRHLAEHHDGYAALAGRPPWCEAQARSATAAVAQCALTGYCVFCQAAVVFRFDPSVISAAREGIEPDWRESTHCPQCGLSARHRLAWHVFATAAHGPRARIYTTEGVTRFHRLLAGRLRNVQGSEYVPGRRLGRRVTVANRRTENQNLTALTYDDGSFDAVFCLEVLEHVAAYEEALNELHRVLSPGGQLVLTVPFLPNECHTTVRARVNEQGEVEHLREPEYHGDPLAGQVLCFYNFGWDLLDRIREVGFDDVQLVFGRSDAFGYLGWGNVLIDARRRCAPASGEGA